MVTPLNHKASFMAYTILYDEPHEAIWFKQLHPHLRDAEIVAISHAKAWASVAKVLAYDRPDIVLLSNGKPILVVEETVEVPSGHNVGQRFARLAAAAEQKVPCLYFGPYTARKHGGSTAGPRFMNLRLFGALDAMIRTTKAAVTTINWPVDNDCEVRRDPEKDADVREYLATVLQIHEQQPGDDINEAILKSAIHLRMLEERAAFVGKIRRAEQYDLPPNSVQFMNYETFAAAFNIGPLHRSIGASEVIVYNVGMKTIRSDPYAGMAMLYHYLYVAEHSNRGLVLWFPEIDFSTWRTAAKNTARKDVRLYRHSSEAILFKDQLVKKSDL